MSFLVKTSDGRSWMFESELDARAAASKAAKNSVIVRISPVRTQPEPKIFGF